MKDTRMPQKAIHYFHTFGNWKWIKTVYYTSSRISSFTIVSLFEAPILFQFVPSWPSWRNTRRSSLRFSLGRQFLMKWRIMALLMFIVVIKTQVQKAKKAAVLCIQRNHIQPRIYRLLIEEKLRRWAYLPKLVDEAGILHHRLISWQWRHQNHVESKKRILISKGQYFGVFDGDMSATGM